MRHVRSCGCPELSHRGRPQRAAKALARGPGREGASGAARAAGRAGPSTSTAHVGLRDNGASCGTRLPRASGGRSDRRCLRSPGWDLKD